MKNKFNGLCPASPRHSAACPRGWGPSSEFAWGPQVLKLAVLLPGTDAPKIVIPWALNKYVNVVWGRKTNYECLNTVNSNSPRLQNLQLAHYKCQTEEGKKDAR